jgi:glycerol-3-phosphate dehydrogenase
MMFDLLIIGGGINGVGIANDAAGRGLRVALCEQDDLASGTSCKSSKLIHGGLRYLEYHEFGLVRKALREREILLRKAPHIIKPLQFVMPYASQLRPAWLIHCGLFLYDHLAKRQQLPASHRINLKNHVAGKPLKTHYKTGFTYYDCLADDARLVILNAMQAKQFGAQIFTRTQFVSADRQDDHWQVTIKNVRDDTTQTLQARVLVNAAGPWAENVLIENLHSPTTDHLTLVKGSHIVTPKLYQGNHAYLLQNTDKRVVFVIPFHEHYSLIGTTDLPYQGNPKDAVISEQEINYLCAVVNQYFQQPITTKDIIWTYSGVRPLKASDAKNLSTISRDYSLELDQSSAQAPLLNIFGGKLTTYRQLSEQALKILQPYFSNMGPDWTAKQALPGGDINTNNFADFILQLQSQYSWLPQQLLNHYANNYGTKVHQLLQNAENISDLGKDYGGGLYQIEIDYLKANEWAETMEDILWRRTKFGLICRPE